MIQLMAHLAGDYLFQSDWMANTKTKPGLAGWVAALTHASVYTVPFLFVTMDWGSSRPRLVCS